MPLPILPNDKRLLLFRKLTEVSRALTYAVSLDDVLRLAVERATELLQTDKAVLMLTNTEGLLVVRAAFGLDADATEKFREPLDESLVNRLQGLLRVDPQSFLGVPLVVSGEVTGILAATTTGDHVTEEQEWLLSALADQAAVALEKTRLDEAARFRERVIGIVSHDLRNPIGAILLGAESLLRQEDLGERALNLTTRIHSSAERASRMIRDLLDYTQAHLGSRIPVERRPTTLRAIVDQVVEESRAGQTARSIEVAYDGDPHGEWDSDRLVQVVGNLVGNALAYSPAGSVVHVAVGDHGDWALLVVHNEGPAIDPARLPHIFEPMQRALDANNPSRSVGLGLYIVRHLVQAHGGTVSVESQHGKGTTFTVRIPKRRTSGTNLGGE